MILVWNGGLKLDGVSDGTAPATLGGLGMYVVIRVILFAVNACNTKIV